VFKNRKFFVKKIRVKNNPTKTIVLKISMRSNFSLLVWIFYIEWVKILWNFGADPIHPISGRFLCYFCRYFELPVARRWLLYLRIRLWFAKSSKIGEKTRPTKMARIWKFKFLYEVSNRTIYRCEIFGGSSVKKLTRNITIFNRSPSHRTRTGGTLENKRRSNRIPGRYFVLFLSVFFIFYLFFFIFYLFFFIFYLFYFIFFLSFFLSDFWTDLFFLLYFLTGICSFFYLFFLIFLFVRFF